MAEGGRWGGQRDGGIEEVGGGGGKEVGWGVPVVFQVLLVFSFITHPVLTLHTVCPLWINYTALTHTNTHARTHNQSLTHLHSETC